MNQPFAVTGWISQDWDKLEFMESFLQSFYHAIDQVLPCMNFFCGHIADQDLGSFFLEHRLLAARDKPASYDLNYEVSKAYP